MSITTKKLQLKVPEYTDEIYQTLQELGNNFHKLDEISNDYGSSAPISGIWDHNHVMWNAKPAIGDYVGWVNTRTGRAAPGWEPLKTYENGAYVRPQQDNGHVYICVQAGHSGAMEPVFPTSEEREVQDTRGATAWQRSKRYVKNDIVFPTVDNGRFYVCITEGEAGGTEPDWPLPTGTSVYDGTVVWLCYKIARWKEAGISSLFRPFGKIE
ncbi:hypothetical protein PAE9249_05136 [Paenibacillus sp. CECT 9249]|uniref:hypothetical protein n=1 Tax=Paenibacillus sp. CECT 9249 TaxID=2845385 RepID=UPI001E61C1FC|nr:hypothetical protein [Paenibacillus sp. CECT 9249]CAH0122564.1 hypothetical protein PAE9249_05136 [Paenibacillus sp. CECT 9249]